MSMMILLVVVGAVYFTVVLVAMVAFCWYVVHSLRALTAAQERNRVKLDDLLARSRGGGNGHDDA